VRLAADAGRLEQMVSDFLAGALDDGAASVWLWFDAVRETANVHGGRVQTAREAGSAPALSIVLPRVRIET
jgi:hypothetical protein